MRRYTLPIVITSLAVALLAVLTYGISSQTTNSSIDGLVARGDYPIAPNAGVTLPVLGSSARESLRDFRGKVVLMNVFASWCGPCQQEAPVIEHAERLLERHDGTVLGIAYLDNPVDEEAFMRQYHLTYPVLSDVNGTYVHAFGTTGVPESFVINRTGHIQALQRYQLDMKWVNQTLPRILAERS
jgi:cytochrome c biogenesis protein CcmG, thiol:disulfide interchange protein DsbE